MVHLNWCFSTANAVAGSDTGKQRRSQWNQLHSVPCCSAHFLAGKLFAWYRLNIFICLHPIVSGVCESSVIPLWFPDNQLLWNQKWGWSGCVPGRAENLAWRGKKRGSEDPRKLSKPPCIEIQVRVKVKERKNIDTVEDETTGSWRDQQYWYQGFLCSISAKT